jgi:glutathionylspermidine synthase
MLEPIRELNRSYLAGQQDAGNDAVKDFKFLNDYLVRHLCTFRGEPMPSLLKPNFISEQQTRLLAYAVEKISSALNKFISLYVSDEGIRRIMKFSSREEELFRIDPGYSKTLVIARLDAFLDDYSITFLEFNCDSPAGIAYADVQEAGFRELFKDNTVFKNWKIDYFRRQERLVNALMRCYGEYRSGHTALPERPVIAIIDWEDVSTYSEFQIHERYFRQKGYETVICSPYDISLKQGRVYALDREVHLIYRRVITRELIERWEEAGTFIHSLKEGKVCCCNPFRSYIVGSKKVLTLITDPRFQHIYSNEELRVIRETIPWTKVLADTKVVFHEQEAGLKNLVADNKDRFVLKPANSYGGKDVHIGLDTDQHSWEKVLNAHLYDDSWVVQEYVTIPRDTYPEVGEKVAFRDKYVNINPFALLEKYSGTISRVSDDHVINVSAGGGLVPTLTVKRRDD